MKEKVPVYKKWWFLATFIIIIITIIGISIASTKKATTENSNSKEVVAKEENPYKVIDDYDGIYSFLLLDDNGNGYMYDSVGAIEIKEGSCKIKYKVLTKDNEYGREYEGFVGKNKEDEDAFYIKLNNDSKEEYKSIYKCTYLDNKLTCELVSKFNLSGCDKKELELIKTDGTRGLNEIYSQKLEEERARRKEEEARKVEEEKQAFIASCQNYTFEEMARNPNNFKGTNVKLTGEVVQVMTDSYSTNLRVNITKKGNYSTYYTDTIYVVYHPKSGEDKILEKDIVTIYGTSQGDCSYQTVMGSRVTLPNIEAKYIIIQK